MSLVASVVVPTYNRGSSLEKCVNALLESSTEFRCEVVIVDDCSQDGTEDVVRRLQRRFANVIYIRNGANSGRCKTRNNGILAAKGWLIVMLDDDIVPEPGFLNAHCQLHFQDASSKLAVIGNVRYAFESICGTNIGRYLQSRYLGSRNEIDKPDLQAQHFATGNCSFRREDAFRAGLLDERFRYYGGEDVFFGYKLKSIGVRLAFCEEAIGIHWDKVGIEEQKEKIMQTSRNGMKIILSEAPGLFESSPIRYLAPYDSQTDSTKTMLIKAIVHALAHRGVVRAVERFAKWSDKIPWLYSKLLFHYLVTGWTIAGLKQPGSQGETVRYGCNGTTK